MKTILSLILNIVIVVWMLYALRGVFSSIGKPTMANECKTFRFFTTDSNILSAVAALVIAIADIIFLIKGTPVPKWVVALKFSGTTAVTVTMMTVLCFLAPTQGWREMLLVGDSLYVHLIGPLLALVSFVFFESGILTKLDLIWGVLPTVVYGIVYARNVLFAHCWKDFYGFTRFPWVMSMIAMFIATGLFAIVIRLVHNCMQ